MLKKAFLFLLILVLIPLSYGLNITSNFDSYGYKETIIGNIDLNDAYNPIINFQNLIFLDQNNLKKNIGLTLTKIDNTNYIYYFDFPINSSYGNYTIYLKDIEFLDNDVLFRTNISKMIRYTPENYSLSVDPAIIYVNDISNNNFLLLIIKNNIDPVNVTITKPFFLRLNSNYILMKSNSTFILQILLDKNYDYNEGFNDYLKIYYADKTLNIPIYVYNKNKINNIESNTKKLVNINEKNFINKTLDINDTLNGPFLFKNIGDLQIQNVSLSIPSNFEDILQVQQKEFNNVNSDQEIDFNLTLNPNKLQNIGIYSGTITINYDDNILEFPFTIELTSTNNLTKASLENITLINSTNYFNYTNTTNTSEKQKQEFNWIWIIIIFFIILIITLSIFLFKKPKRKKDSDNFDQIISDYMKK